METSNINCSCVQNRINALIAEIGEKVKEINSSSNSDAIAEIIPVDQRADFIWKQSELIRNFIERDAETSQDDKVEKLKYEICYYRDKFWREQEKVRTLKDAIDVLLRRITQ